MKRYLFLSFLFGIVAMCQGASSKTAVAKAPPKLPPAPAGVVIQQNVSFLAPGRTEKLDLYLPDGRAAGIKSPAVVIIHGGGWVGGDKAASREFQVGTTLAKAGYVCASVNYVLGNDAWPQNLFDCKNAVRFLRVQAERYGIDTNNIGVMGGSAGGHLALMVAYTSHVGDLQPQKPYPDVPDDVRCVIDLYGISNLLTRKKTDANGEPTSQFAAACIMKCTRDECPEQWKRASPVWHVNKKTPPTLILHGKRDTTVNYQQSEELAQKLDRCGVENKLILIEGVGHTFDLEKWAHKPLPLDLRPVVLEFFDKHLKVKNATARE